MTPVQIHKRASAIVRRFNKARTALMREHGDILDNLYGLKVGQRYYLNSIEPSFIVTAIDYGLRGNRRDTMTKAGPIVTMKADDRRFDIYRVRFWNELRRDYKLKAD